MYPPMEQSLPDNEDFNSLLLRDSSLSTDGSEMNGVEPCYVQYEGHDEFSNRGHQIVTQLWQKVLTIQSIIDGNELEDGTLVVNDCYYNN